MSKKIFLITIALSLALFLRVFNLGSADVYTDESILAFRSLGLIDYNASVVQTSPWQWFEEVPGWAGLSMHDHPIGFFLLQHLSLKIFGVNNPGVRLPSVLSGIGAVFMLYLIGRRMFGGDRGLIAAALLSVSSYHVWVSRLGIQDGVVIFMTLLAFWLYLKVISPPDHHPLWSSLRARTLPLSKGEITPAIILPLRRGGGRAERGRRGGSVWLWLLLGAVIGFGVLVKYTFIIIIPIIVLHTLVYRIPVHRQKFFWYGLLAAFIVTAPSWLYNLNLYQTRGHFDFQISAFLNQNVPEWQVRLGRSLTGGIDDRAVNFFRALYHGNSQLFNLAAGLSFLYAIFTASKKKDRLSLFLIGTAILFFLFFLAIGSTYRFVVMIIPWLILNVLYLLSNLKLNKSLSIIYYLLSAFLLFELFYSANSFLLVKPIGKQNLNFAQINEETQNLGFNQLENYLKELLENKMPLFVGTPKYRFIADIQEESISNFVRQKRDPYPGIIIYEKNLNFLATLWYLDRLRIYEGWPVLADTEFEEITGDRLDEFYREQGVKEFVYITAADEKVLREKFDRVKPAHKLKEKLGSMKIEHKEIKNRAGDLSFKVYRF